MNKIFCNIFKTRKIAAEATHSYKYDLELPESAGTEYIVLVTVCVSEF